MYSSGAALIYSFWFKDNDFSLPLSSQGYLAKSESLGEGGSVNNRRLVVEATLCLKLEK